MFDEVLTNVKFAIIFIGNLMARKRKDEVMGKGSSEQGRSLEDIREDEGGQG